MGLMGLSRNAALLSRKQKNHPETTADDLCCLSTVRSFFFCQGMVSQNHVNRPSPKEWQLSLDPHVLFLQLLEEWYLGLGYFL